MIIAVSITLIVLLLLIQHYHSRKEKKQRKFRDLCEITCPDALPLIGNITEIFWNACDLWRVSRKRALDNYPIYRLKMLDKNIVCLMDPEDIKMILGERRGSNKGPFYDPFRKLAGNGLVVNNGESWGSRRKLLTKCFHFSILRNYIDIFNREISSTIFTLRKNLNQYVDVCYHVQNTIFKIMNETILGNNLKITDEESRSYIESMETVSRITLLKATNPYMNLLWHFLKEKKEEEEALSKIGDYISKAIKGNSIIEVNNCNDHPNMLHTLLSAPDMFDPVAVRNEIDTFIFAGQDTSSISLSFMLMALANYPQYQEKIYQEIKTIVKQDVGPSYSDLTSMEYMDRFIKESLRLYPPLIMIERILTEEVITKTGYRLPVGTRVLFQILDIHRNPNLFTEPEIFDPDRFLLENVVKRHPFSYIPFSAGPRNCIGQKFAILQIKAIICGLLRHFKLEPVTIIENIEFLPDVMLQVKGGIKVKFTRR